MSETVAVDKLQVYEPKGGDDQHLLHYLESQPKSFIITVGIFFFHPNSSKGSKTMTGWIKGVDLKLVIVFRLFEGFVSMDLKGIKIHFRLSLKLTENHIFAIGHLISNRNIRICWSEMHEVLNTND